MKSGGTQHKLLQETDTFQLWEVCPPGGKPLFEVRRRRVTRLKCRRVNWAYPGLNSALQKFNDLLPGAAEKVAEIEKGQPKTAGPITNNA